MLTSTSVSAKVKAESYLSTNGFRISVNRSSRNGTIWAQIIKADSGLEERLFDTNEHEQYVNNLIAEFGELLKSLDRYGLKIFDDDREIVVPFSQFSLSRGTYRQGPNGQFFSPTKLIYPVSANAVKYEIVELG